MLVQRRKMSAGAAFWLRYSDAQAVIHEGKVGCDAKPDYRATFPMHCTCHNPTISEAELHESLFPLDTCLDAFEENEFCASCGGGDVTSVNRKVVLTMWNSCYIACRLELKCESRYLYQCLSLKTTSLDLTCLNIIRSVKSTITDVTEQEMYSFSLKLEAVVLLISFLNNIVFNFKSSSSPTLSSNALALTKSSSPSSTNITATLEFVSKDECCVKLNDRFATRIGFNVLSVPQFTKGLEFELNVEHWLKLPVELCHDDNEIVTFKIVTQNHQIIASVPDVFQFYMFIKKITCP